MYTTPGEEIQKECFDKKLFTTTGTGPDYHIHRKDRVNCHVDEHEGGNTATFIEQHYQCNDVKGLVIEAHHQPAT